MFIAFETIHKTGPVVFNIKQEAVYWSHGRFRYVPIYLIRTRKRVANTDRNNFVSTIYLYRYCLRFNGLRVFLGRQG